MTNATIKLKDGRQINITLDSEAAPLSVANFISLANDGFYKGLIFHRVIKNFMIQGGGMDENMQSKEPKKTIKGEFKSNGVANGRKHTAGTLSMARTMVKDSASSQFFICTVNTPHLDGEYAAFGCVADEDSMRVVLDIGEVKTKTLGYYGDVPINPIIIDDIIIL